MLNEKEINLIPSDSFKPAPMTSNEERRLEALKKLGVIGTDQGDIFEIYSELALEVSGFLQLVVL